MRSLDAARRRARAVRPAHPNPATLLALTREWIEKQGFDIDFVSAAALDDGHALLSPAEEMLYVNEALQSDPRRLLVTLAHERGHLELHERVRRRLGRIDAVAGSAYAGDGAAATARYHRHSREEAEATAFAVEYVCPSQEVYGRWQRGEAVDALALTYGVSPGVVRAQLAQALFDQEAGRGDATPHAGTSSSEPVADDPARRQPDDAQAAAATHTGTPLLVRAGPGTGKTATLLRRLVFLIEEVGAEPESILVLTFSNDAAAEVRSRVAGRFDPETARRLDVQTFHGFGWSVLRSFGDRLGLSEKARILDEPDVEDLVRDLIGQPEFGPLVDLYEAPASIRRVAEAITRLKERVGDDDRPLSANHVAEALADWKPESEEEATDYARADAFLAFLRHYEAEKHRRQRVDFADLIALPTRLLRDHPDSIRAQYRAQYPWVLVDEYQDVSRTVAGLLKQLCGPDNPIWAVGDDHQAIYRFRGAAPANVLRFCDDFPSADVVDLGSNYRACPELTTEACRLAALLDDPAREGLVEDERWTPRSSATALLMPARDGAPSQNSPLRIVEAESEQAEREGTVRQVQAWIEAGADPADIAVLARRNVEVEEVALALGKAGIRAAASAMVTPDGLAGTLAAVVTVPEHPRSALPRLAWALGQGVEREMVDEAVRLLLASEENERVLPTATSTPAVTLARRVWTIVEQLEAVRYSEDGFGMMATFLFDGGALRPLLAQTDEVRRALDLAEVVTALTLAAGYRYSHADESVAERRRGLGQRFRWDVAHAIQSHVPAPHPPNAVRVMTLHASKGLEFPLVVVMGQVLPNIPAAPPLLPPSLRMGPEAELEQADAMVFVGATRAQRSLVVTYAPKKSLASRPHQVREVPRLLQRWPAAAGVGVQRWTQSQATSLKKTPVPPVWGSPAISVVSASAIGETTCALAVYLNKGLRLRFPAEVKDLFPEYVAVVRDAMRSSAVDDDDVTASVAAHVEAAWSARARAHPHRPLYQDAAERAVASFMEAIRSKGATEPLPMEVEVGPALPTVRLGLAGRLRRPDGSHLSVALHARGSVAKKQNRKGELTWSKLGSGVKAALAADFAASLHAESRPADPSVYSVSDQALIQATWKRGGGEAEAELAVGRLRMVHAGPFTPKADPYTCRDCEHRLVCPFWLHQTDAAVTSEEQEAA